MSEVLPAMADSGDAEIDLRKWALSAALHDNLEIEPNTTILQTAEVIYQWLRMGPVGEGAPNA